MNIQPVVRIFLTFLVAGLSTAVATVDDETFRIIAGIILSGLAAVGIVPPHVPTRTVIDTENEPVNIVREEGQSIVELCFALAFLVIAVVLISEVF